MLDRKLEQRVCTNRWTPNLRQHFDLLKTWKHVKTGSVSHPHQRHHKQDQPGDQGADGKRDPFPLVFNSIPALLQEKFIFLTINLLPLDPLQQAIHCNGHPLDLWVHALLCPREPRARRVPFHDRVCPEDDRVHQPPPRMPHLLHLCLQGVHTGQGDNFVTNVFHLNI